LVTTTVRDHAAEVPLDESHGLDHPSVANCDEIYTISKARLLKRRGRLRFEEDHALRRALRIALEL
jgi:mRNA-degrading endonuclease toxin of MazEF toxin-antitoxin module